MLRDLVPTEVLELSPAEIACCDIAELNLCAAHGLPGIECVDAGKLLNRLDDWSYQVRVDICQHLYRLDPRSKRPPTQFSHGNSLARFLCWHLLQVLQKDCGVAYHPDRKFNPDFCHPEDLFIHGIVEADGKGGTCGSMPVVYVAVAKRLEFPVHLVETKGHLFFRWEDSKGTRLQWVHPKLNLWIPPDRFNVEGSGEGIAYYDDAFYVQWPELWNENDAAHGRYLKSLTNVDAFASFLVQRAECFYEAGQWQQCIQSIENGPQAHARRSSLRMASCQAASGVAAMAAADRCQCCCGSQLSFPFMASGTIEDGDIETDVGSIDVLQ